jgi:2-keto-3-deoxy-L-fuconate dehydrogenase
MAVEKKIKVALVTSGASGIGKSICLRLALKNINILVVDLNLEAAQETVKEIISNGGSAEAYAVDVSNNSQVLALFKNINDEHTIDILINNAGIAHIGNIEQTSESDLDRLYNINVKGVYNCISGTIKAMKAQKNGVIINMASVASSIGIADRFACSMTKGAVLTMTYSVNKGYIAESIRCHCISPGRVHTPFVDNFLEQNYADNREEMFKNFQQVNLLAVWVPQMK